MSCLWRQFPDEMLDQKTFAKKAPTFFWLQDGDLNILNWWPVFPVITYWTYTCLSPWALDTLSTTANLQRSKKSPSDLCKLYIYRQTKNHVLNIFRVGLDLNTGRRLLRHNTIFNYFVWSVNTNKFTVFSDLEGNQTAGGGTIPPEICITSQRPHLVILDKE